MSKTEMRSMLQSVPAGSLGTLDSNGAPFVSLVTVAATDDAKMLMLLSDLAIHTKNLAKQGRASLLLVAAGGETGDPLSGARVTLVGDVQKLPRDQDQHARAAFLSKHAAAEMYADFGDFAIYELTIQSAHLVAGFGRIETMNRSELISQTKDE